MSENNPSVSVLGKLPKFDGRSSIKKFLKNIDKRSSLESWDDAKKANIVKYLCTDIAEGFIDSHPELENCSYKDLCTELNNRFKLKITKPEAYAQLMNIKQNNLGITDYAGKIESTAADLSEIIPELADQAGREELLISIFLNGLAQNIKRMLVSTEYEDFSEIVRAAKRCEHTLGEQRRGVGAVEPIEPLVNVRDSKRTCHCTDSCEDNYLRNRDNSFQRQNIDETRKQRYNPPVCWLCGQPGHLRRNCSQMRQHYYEKN